MKQLLCSYLLYYVLIIGHGSSVNVSGRVEAGHVQNGSSVVVLPANEAASVKGESHVSECSCCHACFLFSYLWYRLCLLMGSSGRASGTVLSRN